VAKLNWSTSSSSSSSSQGKPR